MELDLHKLQVSARVISRDCDTHNRRFATASCEPVTLGNGSHAHQQPSAQIPARAMLTISRASPACQCFKATASIEYPIED